jgi:hypothetical protein
MTDQLERTDTVTFDIADIASVNARDPRDFSSPVQSGRDPRRLQDELIWSWVMPREIRSNPTSVHAAHVRSRYSDSIADGTRWADNEELIFIKPFWDRASTSEQSLASETVATSYFLRALESASGPAERRKWFTAVLRNCDPERIAQAALDEYDQTGRETLLLHAAALLEAAGEYAAPALEAISGAGREEVELFLGVIARCEGLNSRQRSLAFRRVVAFAPQFIHSALFEHLDSLEPADVRALLTYMSERSTNENVRQEAKERIESFPLREL